jgi:triacylglycerol lipase
MRSRPLLASLASMGAEALALARQASLLHRDVERPVLPARSDHDDVVILLHGLFATAGVLRPLRRALERAPHVGTATLSYPPGPGVEALAARLDALCDELFDAGLGRETRLHLVGHSLGGIVCRHFAQTRTHLPVAQTISLASPFAGVRRAELLSLGGRLEGARDLAEDSPVLRALRLSPCRVPHLSIVAHDDVLLGSPLSHALPGGEVVLLRGRGHNALLFDDEVASLVHDRVLGFSRRFEPLARLEVSMFEALARLERDPPGGATGDGSST